MGRLCLLAALTAFAAVDAAHAQAAEQAAVREAFARYRAAALAADGTAALAAVSTTTVDHYGQMLDLALDGDSAAVAARPFMDRLLVFTLRHRVLPSDLRRLTGAGALVYGVKRGWVDAEATRRQGLGEVNVEGDLAVGRMTEDGRPDGDVWLRFAREDGAWRVDLTSLFDIVSYGFAREFDERGVDPNPSIFTLLEAISGRPVADAIWDPIGRG